MDSWIFLKQGNYARDTFLIRHCREVCDAKYLVFHKGGVTEFKVNQQMGGGTWVYLALLIE